MIAASLYFSVSQIDNLKQRQTRDLELSSSLLAASLKEAVEPLLAAGAKAKLQSMADRFGGRGRLAGVAIYDRQARIVAATKAAASMLRSEPRSVIDCLAGGVETADYESLAGAKMRVNVLPLRNRRGLAGALAVFYDTAFIDARIARTRWNNARRLAIQGVLFVAAIWVFGFLLR